MNEIAHPAATAVLPDGSATLSPADLTEVRGALRAAEMLVRERADAPCGDCVRLAGAGRCELDADDLARAESYRALAARLGGAS